MQKTTNSMSEINRNFSFLFEANLKGTANSINRKLSYYRTIISYLYANPQTSVSKVVIHSQLSQPLIAILLIELIEMGVVVENGLGNSIGGRPPKVYSLNPDYQFVVGVDIHLSSINIAIFNLNNEIISRREFADTNLENDEKYADNLAALILSELDRNNLTSENIIACGLSLPGLVDAEHGKSITHLSFADEGISTYLEQKLGFTVLLENDCKMMAMGEKYFGKAKNKKNVLCLNLSAGIGLGLIINGVVYRGADGFAGEFGHILIDPKGDLCSCGKIGCLETLCSGTVITRKVNEAINRGEISSLSANKKSGEIVSLSQIIDAANQGDLLAITQINESASYLGKGLVTLIHVLNPELIIVGGELAKAEKIIKDSLELEVNKFLMKQFYKKTGITCSDLLENATLLGTMAHVMESILDKNNY